MINLIKNGRACGSYALIDDVLYYLGFYESKQSYKCKKNASFSLVISVKQNEKLNRVF